MKNTQSNFPKIQLLLSTLFFCILLAMFWYFLRQININIQESQVAEEKWRTEALRRDEIKALDRSVKIIESERGELETHFAKSSDIVPFLDTMEDLAKQAEAKAEVTSVSILTDSSGLLVGMKSEGNFNNIYKFISLLENSPYELEFITVDLQKEMLPGVEGEVKQTLKWEATLKIKLLSFIK